MLKVPWPISGRPRLDPRRPKNLPVTEAAEYFSGRPAPTLILFHFLLVGPCGPGSCPASPRGAHSLLQVHGLKPGRCSCLHPVYQDRRHVNACSICSQHSPCGWNYRNSSNPVAKKKMPFLNKKGHQDLPCAYLGAGHGPLCLLPRVCCKEMP